jgi:uncharacterized ferritin-like protein (DUF455 family)
MTSFPTIPCHASAPKPHLADGPTKGRCLRSQALQLLLVSSAQEKASAIRALDVRDWQVDPQTRLQEPGGVPGRPQHPKLVHPSALSKRAVGTPQGRASLIHALAHIEANAINLALDIIWRFDGLPEMFYRDWWQVAIEEALHFELLAVHLQSLGYTYGDFPAHDGLWDMAAKTTTDVLARLALVPRTLEARGLDVTPAIQNKLVSVGDQAGAAILDVILRDEIGHVATGNRWFNTLCAEHGQNPVQTYAQLARRYEAPALKGPFNMPARRAAGFSENELAALCGTPQTA